jgi:hypothetical protein
MKSKPSLPEHLIISRQKWAQEILEDVERKHGDSVMGTMSLRKMALLLGVSHQAPMTWLTGRSLPSKPQIVKLSKYASRDVVAELLKVEELRSTDSQVEKYGKQH